MFFELSFFLPRQVSLLPSQDIFVCRSCFGHTYSVKEKVEFNTDEDAREEVEKFYYLGDMLTLQAPMV